MQAAVVIGPDEQEAPIGPMAGRVREQLVVEPMGNEQIVYVTLSGGDRLIAVAPPQELIKPGDIVSIRVRPEGVHIFDAESGKRIDPSPQPVAS